MRFVLVQGDNPKTYMRYVNLIITGFFTFTQDKSKAYRWDRKIKAQRYVDEYPLRLTLEMVNDD